MTNTTLTDVEKTILGYCLSSPVGWIGWPLSVWRISAQGQCQSLIERGDLKYKRIAAGYPGVKITDAGKEAFNG